MRPLGVLCLFAAAVFAQTNNENMVRQRGQTSVPNESQALTHGRLGTQQMLPKNAVTVTGILIDASCEDRSSLNLRTKPLPLAAQLPAQPPNAAQGNPPRQGPVSAGGVSIDAQTIARERADIMPHQAPDMLTREEDPTCAVTAATRGYSVLTDSGRFLDLDEGGNTLTSEAILGNARGRAMLNGQAPGIKPRIVVKGWSLGDRFVVDSVVQLQ